MHLIGRARDADRVAAGFVKVQGVRGEDGSRRRCGAVDWRPLQLPPALIQRRAGAGRDCFTVYLAIAGGMCDSLFAQTT